MTAQSCCPGALVSQAAAEQFCCLGDEEGTVTHALRLSALLIAPWNAGLLPGIQSIHWN